MEAIRQFVKVKNRQINIVLPEGFDAEEVEVIVFPSSPDSHRDEVHIPQWQIDEVRERTEEYLKNPDIALDFDEAIKDIENEL